VVVNSRRGGFLKGEGETDHCNSEGRKRKSKTEENGNEEVKG
jgi:hypothetical protein